MQKTIKRLEQLRKYLIKSYQQYHRTVDTEQGLSLRMYAWLKEYDDYRYTTIWVDFCTKYNFDQTHRATDYFA